VGRAREMARPHIGLHFADTSAIAPIVAVAAVNLVLLGLLVAATAHGGGGDGAATPRPLATASPSPTPTPPQTSCRVLILVPSATDGTPPSWPPLPDLHGCHVAVYAMPAEPTAAAAPIVTGIFASSTDTLTMSNTDVRVIDLRGR
jgi:hypothetical protein